MLAHPLEHTQRCTYCGALSEEQQVVRDVNGEAQRFAQVRFVTGYENMCCGYDERRHKWVHIVQAEPGEKGRWHPSRARAWYACVAAGRRVGIPDHGWRKRHIYHEDGSATWCWYTV